MIQKLRTLSQNVSPVLAMCHLWIVKLGLLNNAVTIKKSVKLQYIIKLSHYYFYANYSSLVYDKNNVTHTYNTVLNIFEHKHSHQNKKDRKFN